MYGPHENTTATGTGTSKTSRVNEQNKITASVSRFFVNSLSSLSQLSGEMTKLKVYLGTETERW